MEAMAILRPEDRSVLGKLQLFLRLRVVRQSYEQLAPPGATSAERIQFHLAQLENCWSKVIEFQRVLGLEAVQFAPREQFEKIYVVSVYAEREFIDVNNTMLDAEGSWETYRRNLAKLSFELNPFDFAEVCLHCQQSIFELNWPAARPPNVISLDSNQAAKLHGMSGQVLTLADA
jgi:hypothetical protein